MNGDSNNNSTRISIPTEDGLREALCFPGNGDTLTAPRLAVLALHGAGSCAEAMIDFCGLNETAGRNGWIMVYPNGSGRTPTARTWNARADCGYAGRHNIDDVAFFDRLTRELEHRYGDLTFCTVGMSNGGMMSYRLADELPGRFRSIVSVAGVIPRQPSTTGPATSVLHLHGTDDQYVPFDGGVGSQNRLRKPMMSAIESVNGWAARNGCATLCPEYLPVAPIQNDGTKVDYLDFGPGRDGTHVRLYRIHGGGHTWPGRPSPMEFLGQTTGNLVANAAIEDFFSVLTV